MRESNYWLRFIKETFNDHERVDVLDYLIDESDQLKKIFGVIVCRTRNQGKGQKVSLR